MLKQVTKAQATIGDYETAVILKGRGVFQNKANRDAVATLLKVAGHKVKLSSSRSQQIHPEYVTDFVGTYETGFGNTDYQTFFPNLYKIEIVS